MRLIQPADQQELERILNASGVDPERWQEGQKNIQDLWEEIGFGDCQLVQENDGRLVRRIRVVAVLIRHENQVLIEDNQTSSDGTSVRHRRLPGSLIEKMIDGESPAQATLRVLLEEMDLELHPRDLGIFEQAIHSHDCYAYPGLAGEYHLYRTQVQVPLGRYQQEYLIEFDGWTTSWRWIVEDQAERFLEPLDQ